MVQFKFKRSSLFWMVLIAILFNWSLHHLGKLWEAFQYLLKLSLPIVVGIALTFFIGVFVDVIESRLLKASATHKKYNSYRRPISVFLAILLVIGFFVILIVFIIPLILQNIQDFGKQVPAFIERLDTWLRTLAEKNPAVNEWLLKSNINSEEITKYLTNFFSDQLPTALGSFIRFTSSIITIVFTLVISLIFSIYFLLQKEAIISHLLKILYAFTSEKTTQRVSKLMNLTATAFKNFVTGQLIEGINVGILMYVSMLIFKFPQPFLVSFIIGLTALIPMFGSFIGVGLGAMIVGIVDPSKVLWFVLMAIIVIQFDNNVIYPKVVGDKMGTPAIIVLLAVTFFGNLFGLVGMIIGVPIASIIYSIISEVSHKRVQDKLEVKPLSKPVRVPRN